MWFDALQSYPTVFASAARAAGARVPAMMTAAGADVQSSTTCLRNMGAKGYAKNQIPGQIDRNRLASDSQAAAGRQQPASLARDEHG